MAGGALQLSDLTYKAHVQVQQQPGGNTCSSTAYMVATHGDSKCVLNDYICQRNRHQAYTLNDSSSSANAEGNTNALQVLYKLLWLLYTHSIYTLGSAIKTVKTVIVAMVEIAH